jgi:hypothetical protein
MIERMQRSKIPTAVAEEVLRMMRKIAEQMRARIKSMTGSVSGD